MKLGRGVQGEGRFRGRGPIGLGSYVWSELPNTLHNSLCVECSESEVREYRLVGLEIGIGIG